LIGDFLKKALPYIFDIKNFSKSAPILKVTLESPTKRETVFKKTLYQKCHQASSTQ